MPRSIIDHLAITRSPDFALAMLTGSVSIFLVANPSEKVKAYTGKMLLHTAGYPDPTSENELYRMYKDTLNPDTIPAYAIQARLSVKKVFLMDPVLFTTTADKHGMGGTLQEYLTDSYGHPGLDLYAVEFDPRKTEVLAKPVTGITGYPENIGQTAEDGEAVQGGDVFFQEGDIWPPANPLVLNAFKMALDKNRPLIQSDQGA